MWKKCQKEEDKEVNDKKMRKKTHEMGKKRLTEKRIYLQERRKTK